MCLAAASLLTSCAGTYQAVGKVGMLAPDRVENGVNYQPLATNTGSSKKVITASKAQTVSQAVQQVINTVPGGKYMTNVTVYVVDGGYIAVKGDVWGVSADTVPTAQESNDYFSMKVLNRQKNLNITKALVKQ